MSQTAVCNFSRLLLKYLKNVFSKLQVKWCNQALSTLWINFFTFPCLGFSSQPKKNLSTLILMYTCWQSLSSFLVGNITLWFFNKIPSGHILWFGRKFKMERKKLWQNTNVVNNARWGGKLFSNEKRNDPKSTCSVTLPSRNPGWVGTRRRWCFLKLFFGTAGQ